MPEISIIVPVYKVEQWLNRCVESILNQTFVDFELLLIDDGSPDNCPQMCDEWAKKDSRIKVIHKKNGGASSARNVGLREATGYYIGFVDSDDWIEPDMYKDLHIEMRKNNADMAICEMFRDKRKERAIIEDKNIQIWDKKKCLDHFFRLNGEEDTHCIWNRLIKRDLLKDFSFIEGKMNEDVHACFMFASLSNKIVYTKSRYYHYTFNESGVTNSKFTVQKLDLLDVWDEVEKIVEIKEPEYLKPCRMNMKRARFTLLSKMYIDGYDKRDFKLQSIKRKLKKEVRASFLDLMKWKMPISRKLLMAFICI